MWEPAGKLLDQNRVGSLAPEKVLYEYDGEPLTYLATDPDSEPLLVHSLCVFDRISRYLVSAIDERILQELDTGRIDLLTALRQPRCWIADLAEDASVHSVWSIAFAAIPERVLPTPGAMLNPDLDPLFRIRLIGPGVGPGKTTAGDIRTAAQAAEFGLRGLAWLALDERKRVGPVPGDVRHYSDLPYRFSRAASFEIAFGRPVDRLPHVDDEVFDEMGRLLEQGLKAVRATEDEVNAAPIKGLNADQTAQLFEVIKALTPPSRGGVRSVEIGGGLLDGQSGPKTLTREDRRRSIERIRSIRKPPRTEDPFRVTGIIEEADQGASSFTLRQLTPPPPESEMRFHFEDHLYDAVMDAFNSLERWVVVGQRIGSSYQALDLQAVDDVFVDARKDEGATGETP